MSENHRGRPRDHALDDRLLEAATAVFLERGYHAASLTEIARRAGVGTPAIYRRWPAKSALAIDVVARSAAPAPIPDTGSVRADLVTFVKQRLGFFRSRIMHRVMLPVIVESTADEQLAAQIRSTFLGYREALHNRLVKATRSGQLRPGVDPARLVDNLMGTILMPLLFSIDVPADTDAGAIVDQVLLGARPRRRG